LQNEVKGINIENFSLEGFNPPFDFYPDAISIVFRILVFNPTDYSVELDRLVYTIYIEDHYLGSGVKERIYISANGETPLYLKFTARTGDALRIIGDMVKQGDTAVDYKIEGHITVPVKLFGIIRLLSIDVPFEKSGYYVIPIKIPGTKPTIKGINAYWSSTQVRLGSTVNAIVEVERVEARGRLDVVIMKDIPLLPDKEVYRKTVAVGGIIQNARYYVHFTPDEASSWKLRGYYIVIEINGVQVWVQPDGYPPRLRVIK